MNKSSRDLKTVDAYPLDWPDENTWPRNERPERSNFHTKAGGKVGNRPKTIEEARKELERELDLLGVSNPIISTNVPVRKSDGKPYSNAKEPDDSGVAVYFTQDGEARCIPCDKWDRVADNIYAIAKTINALRGIDRWGTKQIIQAAFSGFKALPENAGGMKWWNVLGVEKDTRGEQVKRAFKKKIKKAHPDAGGSTEEFQQVKRAYDQAKQVVDI